MYWVSWGLILSLPVAATFELSAENRYLVLAQCTYVVLDEVSLLEW